MVSSNGLKDQEIIRGNSQWLGVHTTGSIPGWGSKIPQAARLGQKKKNHYGMLFHKGFQFKKA